MKSTNTSRRNFIRKASLSTLVALTTPQIILSSFAEETAKVKRIKLNNNDIILFQGDSITDAGRVKTESAANNQKALGTGYAFLATADLLNAHPDKALKIFNKGISGNKVYQLAERWDTDAIEIKPSVLSILVGVNDYWHMKKHNYTGTVETYRNDYNALLDRTKQKFPDIKLIIGEPFAILGTSVEQSWFAELKPYQAAAKELADKYGAAFIPYQRIFNNAIKLAPVDYWAPDGVHPSIAGARLMASAWLEAVNG